MAKRKQGDWRVRCRCVVTKDVYCKNCTEEEARTDPFAHAASEYEVDQIEWEVTDVKEEK